MEIRVLGSNIEVGDSLTEFAKDHLEKMVKKYFENAVKLEIHFKKEAHLFKAVLIVNEGVKKGIVVKSDGEAGDVYGALNEATKKAENQLKRYHDRLKNYRHNSSIKSIEPDYKSLNATKYVLPPLPYDMFAEMEESTKNEIKVEAKNNIKIISEKNTEIETLETEEAIMKMDLANLPALVFINKNNGRMNVVYHRKDGLISLIDPQ